MTIRFAKILAISILALGAVTSAANAGCEGRKTTGTVIGAGSAIGVVGGAVLGGLAGHSIAADNCTGHYYRHHARGYYDRHHRWHHYARL